ncbi:encapsulin [Bacteroides sp.]|uniref:encapsulin n=1 Tax=Bacteroides sp. TaxID=29523 RepID=UPI002601FBC7|nr:encapsulin [Bacteroides sp.]MDD3039020.1 hypothetical protein [Bacteroides sp.]
MSTATEITSQLRMTSGIEGKDFAYNDTPALHPDIIVARVKQVYEAALIGRQLLDIENVLGDSVSWIEEGDISGGVDWITEEGGFPKIDFRYTKKSKVIRPYGTFFDITDTERRLARLKTVDRKLARTIRKMRVFEDHMIFNDILTHDGITSFAASNWHQTTGEDKGDPVDDLERAKREMRDLCGVEPDICIMTSQMHQYLTRFDYIRNSLYRSDKFLDSGNFQSLTGVPLVINNAVDPTGENGTVLLVKKKEFGYMAQTLPILTPSIDGLSLSNPMIDRRYFAYAQAEPVIDNPEMVVKMTVDLSDE